MERHDINRWIFEIDLNDILSDDFDDSKAGNHEPCICCGKPVKEVKYQVHLLTNGNLVSTDQEFSSEEDQGFYAIGSACRKKLPNNFVFID